MTPTEILSHALCPFTHRFLIVAEEAALPPGTIAVRRVSYPELANPPAWLRELAPDLAMPSFFYANGARYVDVTAVTTAFAHDRAPQLVRGPSEAGLIAAAGASLGALRKTFVVGTEEAAMSAFQSAAKLLAPYETSEFARPEKMSLSTAAIAPFFALAFAFAPLRAHPAWRDLPKTRAWGERLLDRDSVIRSRAPNFAAEFRDFFATFDGRGLPEPDR